MEGRTPAGRGRVLLEWEVKPRGVPFSVTMPASFPRFITGSRRMACSLSRWMASMTEASSSMVMGFGVIQPPTVSVLSAMSGPRNPG